MANFSIGPCKMTIDPDGTPVTLVLEGGVDISVDTRKAAAQTDDTGDVPVEEVVTGVQASFTANISEYDVEKMVELFPTAVKIGTGASARVEIRSTPGTSLLTKAKKIVFKKVVNGVVSTAKADWITVPKACPSGAVTFGFKKANQTIFPIPFTAYPDTAQNNRVLFFGDETTSA